MDSVDMIVVFGILLEEKNSPMFTSPSLSLTLTLTGNTTFIITTSAAQTAVCVYLSQFILYLYILLPTSVVKPNHSGWLLFS